MPNALLDPLGRDKLPPQELAKTFSIVRANVLFDEFSKFPCFNDLSGAASHVFFHEHDLPEAVVFLSHRWLSPFHPDPDGQRLSAVKTFLSSIKQICDPNIGASADLKNRGLLRRLKRTLLQRGDKQSATSLQRAVLTHGGYQAAYFLGDYNPFNPDDQSGTDLLHLGGNVLSKIGIWYDYCSMPQDPAMRDQLVSALERMHELLGASNLVALRQPGDNYDSRAWCAAEVATDPDIERTRFRKICLRLDKIGEPFPPGLLLDQPPYLEGIGEIALMQLERAQNGAEAAGAIASFIRMTGVDAEDNRAFPLFFVKRKPWLFEGQKEFMLCVMNVLEEASAFDEKSASDTPGFSVGLDLAEMVSDAARSVGLRSSKLEDIPYTSLLILYARHRGAPSLARLFADGLERHLRGRTTVLARYREDRERSKERCWYRFEDEVEGRSTAAWSE